MAQALSLLFLLPGFAVVHLDDARFRTREAAYSWLRSAGAASLPSLASGRAGGGLERARRCESLLGHWRAKEAAASAPWNLRVLLGEFGTRLPWLAVGKDFYTEETQGWNRHSSYIAALGAKAVDESDGQESLARQYDCYQLATVLWLKMRLEAGDSVRKLRRRLILLRRLEDDYWDQ